MVSYYPWGKDFIYMKYKGDIIDIIIFSVEVTSESGPSLTPHTKRTLPQFPLMLKTPSEAPPIYEAKNSLTV